MHLSGSQVRRVVVGCRLAEDAPHTRGVAEGANAELTRRAYKAFAERDLDALLELMHPQIEFVPATADLATGGVPYRGHEGIARYLDDVARV